MAIINAVPDEAATPYMFANAIVACNDWRLAVSLLQRAAKLRLADEAIYTAAAQQCASAGKYALAYKIIDSMLSQDLSLNKYSLSLILTVCLSHGGREGLRAMRKYLQLSRQRYPKLLVNAVCQRIMRALTSSGDILEAMQFHLTYFSDLTCSSDALRTLLQRAQDMYFSPDNNMVNKSKLVETSAFLLQNYYNSPSEGKRKLLRIHHFNSVLKMLSSSEHHVLTDALIDKLMLLADDENATDKDILLENESFSSSYNVRESSLWRPSTFTVAEIVRVARSRRGAELAFRALMWALHRDVHLPSSVIGDAISQLYR